MDFFFDGWLILASFAVTFPANFFSFHLFFCLSCPVQYFLFFFWEMTYLSRGGKREVVLFSSRKKKRRRRRNRRKIARKKSCHFPFPPLVTIRLLLFFMFVTSLCCVQLLRKRATSRLLIPFSAAGLYCHICKTFAPPPKWPLGVRIHQFKRALCYAIDRISCIKLAINARSR